MDFPVIMGPYTARALEEGRKTQTRRLLYVKRKAVGGIPGNASVMRGFEPPRDFLGLDRYWSLSSWHKRRPGDLMWVRETVRAVELPDTSDVIRYESTKREVLIDDTKEAAERWLELHHYGKGRGKTVPAIHMPRWCSRFTLEITAVRIELLHEISEADVLAEGVPQAAIDRWRQWLRRDECAGHEFSLLWDSVNGKGAWEKNPWVVVVEFKNHQCNIDKRGKAA